MKSILCSVCAVLLVLGLVQCQEDFGNEFDCGGTNQSPIDLKTKDLIQKVYKDDLHWSKEYGKTPIKMTATGGGSLTIGSDYSKGAVPTIWGGPLGMTYKLSQFHFHWAQKDRGSEHLVNGHSYVMEMHAVHIKENLTFERATQDKNGIAVVAYFFEYSVTPSHAIKHLIDTFSAVKRNKTAPVTLRGPFPINELVRPISCNYVTYRGSLTTPPCTENVRWIVSPYVVTLSRDQMAQFRDLATSGAVTLNNYRTLQKTNGRNIYYAVRQSPSLHDYTAEDPETRNYDEGAYDDSIHFDEDGHYVEDDNTHF